MPHTLPDLPYPYDALEPHMDKRTVEIHHDLHHGGYVTKLNNAIKDHPEVDAMDLDSLLLNIGKLDPGIQTPVRLNGAQHWNHTFYWESMAPGKGGTPEGDLLKAIEKDFKSLEEFKTLFQNTSIAQFGSGWGWLYGSKDGKLRVKSTSNEGTPFMDGETPLLVVDVWEHAYYLKYKNRRDEFISSWWNLVDWDRVAQRFRAWKENK